MKIEMCRYYSVRMFPNRGFMTLCYKGRKSGLKCHSEARGRGCADYEKSDSWGYIKPPNEVGQPTQHGNFAFQLPERRCSLQ